MTPKRKALGGKSRAKEICPVRLLGHVTGILINSKSRERHHPPTPRTKNLFQVAKNPWCGLLNMLPFPKANLAQPEAASDACDPKLLSVREDFALWPQGNPKMRGGDLLGFHALSPLPRPAASFTCKDGCQAALLRRYARLVPFV